MNAKSSNLARRILYSAVLLALSTIALTADAQTASPAATEQSSPATPSTAQWTWAPMPGQKNVQIAQLASSDGSASLEVFVNKGKFTSFAIRVSVPLAMKDHSTNYYRQVKYNKIAVQTTFDDQGQVSAQCFLAPLSKDDPTPLITQRDYGVVLYRHALASKKLGISLVDDTGKTYTSDFDLTTMQAEMTAHNVILKKQGSGLLGAIVGGAGVL
ncbi:MAG: hypothetical protein WBY53_06940 [Acidobacteriaceae bacterium]